MIIKKRKQLFYIQLDENSILKYSFSTVPTDRDIGVVQTEAELRELLKDEDKIIVDSFIQAVFFIDVDADKNLSWTSKPDELKNEQKFFNENLVR